MAKYSKDSRVRSARWLLDHRTLGKVVVKIVSVAPSNMSRKIRVYIGEMDVTKQVAIVMDKAWDPLKGMMIKGCGQDMIYATLYNVNATTGDLLGLVETHPNLDLENLVFDIRAGEGGYSVLM